MIYTRYLLLAVQTALLTGTLAQPTSPTSAIINMVLAAGKSFNSFGETTPQAPPAPASAFSLPTSATSLPSSGADAGADLLFACRALGVQIYTGGLCQRPCSCTPPEQYTTC